MPLTVRIEIGTRCWMTAAGLKRDAHVFEPAHLVPPSGAVPLHMAVAPGRRLAIERVRSGRLADRSRVAPSGS
jgi:hypothetical protein